MLCDLILDVGEQHVGKIVVSVDQFAVPEKFRPKQVRRESIMIPVFAPVFRLN